MVPKSRGYLRVVRRGAIARTRKIYGISGIGSGDSFLVHNSSIVNIERALAERVFFVQKDGVFQPPPATSDSRYFAALAEFSVALKRNLSQSIPISYDQFVGLYTDRRKINYAKAANRLRHEPISRSDSYLKAFVKAEKINCTLKVDPVPRIIQPRSLEYNVELGCRIKPIECKVYQAIASIFGDVTVMKGYSAQEVGEICSRKWNKFSKPVGIGLDASRFDQHVSPSALRWEHSIYRHIYPGDVMLDQLLEWQIDNVGKAFAVDGKVDYRVQGCRMSGDMNTALGNCLLMCAMVWSFMQKCSIHNFELMNNGDDCMLIFEQDNLFKVTSTLETYFTELGFTMKVEEPVYCLERVVFCQTQPIWTPQGYIMVRDPHVSIKKDCYSIVPWPNINAMKKYLYVLGQGGLSLTGGIPIWQEFYTKLICWGKGFKGNNRITIESGMMLLARNMDRKHSTIHPQTRESFRLAFGIDSDSQVAFENNICAMFMSDWKTSCLSEPMLGDNAWMPDNLAGYFSVPTSRC